jgi:DNA repair exonuclease SbcCD ATPase subunit
MGSGKSSVMNAICFGLFGTFPDLQSRKIKLDDIIMNKPSIKGETQIIVDFTVDGRTYSVMRVIERNKGTTYSEIREGDKLLDAPNSQRVTELVNKLLRINYDLFSRAIYSEQNGLDYFLRLPSGERMRRIDNLLMIDRFETARSNAVTLENKLIEKKTAKQSVVDFGNIGELKENVKDISYSLDKLHETTNKLSDELKNKKKISEDLKKKIKELEILEGDMNEFKNKKNSIEGSLSEIKMTIDKYKKIFKDRDLKNLKLRLDKSTEFLDKNQKELEEERKNSEDLTKKISKNETKINFLQDRIKELELEIKEKNRLKKKIIQIDNEYEKNINKLLEEKKNETEEFKNQITQLLTKIEQVEESLTKISETKDKCPLCTSRISEEKRKNLVSGYKETLKDYNLKLKKFRTDLTEETEFLKKLERVKTEYQIYSEKIKELGKVENELKDKKEEYKILYETISKDKTNIGKIKKKIISLQEYIEKLKDEKQKLDSLIEKLDDLENKEEKFQKYQDKYQEINKKISDYSSKLGKEDMRKIRNDYTKNVSRVTELSTRITSLNEIIKEKKKIRLEYQTKIKEIEQKKKELEELEKIIKNLKIFQKALIKTQTQLRENFIDTVNYTMGNIWPDIYPYGDFISARLAIKERDYILQLQTISGEWVDVDGIASGGERSLASLVLRIAFSYVLAPQLKWIVLDEPTHNLDSRAVEGLSETLRTKIDNFVDQVFLISHDKIMENAVTGNLYRLKRDKENDGDTLIEGIN